MPFSLSTFISSLVKVFWTLFFWIFFSIFSGVGISLLSDGDDDEDGDDDDNNDDDRKDGDNDDGDDEDDDDNDDDDDDWLLCCNCNISLDFSNWFNTDLISSLSFNCFRRKCTSSKSAINVLEPSMGESTTFSNESNNFSLNDLTSAKKNFFFFSIYQNLLSNLL